MANHAPLLRQHLPASARVEDLPSVKRLTFTPDASTPPVSFWRALATAAPRLERIDAPNCAWTSLAGIDVLPLVKHVDAKGNSLEEVAILASEKESGKKKKKENATIRVLDVSHNKLEEHLDLSTDERALRNVVAFVASHNENLRSIDVAALSSLETIVVSHCALSELPTNLPAEHLRKLSASTNSIKSIKPLLSNEPFGNLTELRLSHNLIKRVPASFGEACPSLELLEMTNNRIGSWNDVGDALKTLRRLLRVSLKGNPFTEDTDKYPRVVMAGCPTVTHIDNTAVPGRAKPTHQRGKDWVEKQRAAGVVPEKRNKRVQKDGRNRRDDEDGKRTTKEEPHPPKKKRKKERRQQDGGAEGAVEFRDDPSSTAIPAATSDEIGEPSRQRELKMRVIQNKNRSKAASSMPAGAAALRAALKTTGIQSW